MGGTVECVRQIGSAISGRGHEVHVVACGDAPEAKWLKDFPLPAYAMGPGMGRYAFTPRLRTWLRENGRKYDAWIINGLWQYQGFGAAPIASAMGIPYFVYPHGMLDPWNRRAHPLKFVKKLLYWLAAERRTLQGASGVLFTSEEEAVLAQSYFPVSGWKGVVVGNGIADPPAIEADETRSFRKERSIGEDKRVLLFLSRIHPKKGIDIFLRAYAKSPSVRDRFTVVIAGDGDAAYVSELQALSRRLGLEQEVRWTGPLYGRSKWIAMSAADLFVLPSHQENFGIVVPEAMSMGVPVCTTPHVATYKFVQSDQAGLVCDDEERSLAAALKSWAELDPARVGEMRRNARRSFETNFRVATASQRVLDLIEASIQEKRGTTT